MQIIWKIFNVLKVIPICGLVIFGLKLYPNNQTECFLTLKNQIKDETPKDTSSNSIKYYDVSEFDFIGKLPHTEKYSRLPEEAKDEVRKPVWSLSKNTAGISIRFKSNTTSIAIRWTLKKNGIMSNMTPIATKGFDLYAYRNGQWQFVGVAKPQDSINNQATIIDGMFKEDREYLLNLPLYDGVSSIEVGIDQDSYIKKPFNPIIDKSKPIIFYGTSITQGASASRPGLTYPALIQRKLNKEVINLGFSGNGRFEKEVARSFMKTTPQLVILDCTPNSSANTIRKNLPDLIEYIRSINDSVPILFIESIVRDFAHFKVENEKTFGTLTYIKNQNKALNEIYMEYKKSFKHLYYMKSDDLIGNDNEATIDGTHFNDLGHYRAYKSLMEKIKVIICL